MRQGPQCSVEHMWKVGDLCTCTYDDRGNGLLYRVIGIEKNFSFDSKRFPTITVKPIMGLLTEVEGRRPRTVSAWYCRPMPLIDLATVYMTFGNFIAEEAKKVGEEDGSTSDTQPA